MQTLEAIFGVGHELTALQMCARAGVVFALLLVAVRISGRRSLGQHSAFDFVVAVLLGAVASRAIVGASGFVPAMAASYTIVALHRAVAWLSVRFDRLDLLLNGSERVLVREGRPDPLAMRRALVTLRDLDEAARQHGKDGYAQCARMLLERNGKISVL